MKFTLARVWILSPAIDLIMNFHRANGQKSSYLRRRQSKPVIRRVPIKSAF
jgi:hypothetical protein